MSLIIYILFGANTFEFFANFYKILEKLFAKTDFGGKMCIYKEYENEN